MKVGIVTASFVSQANTVKDSVECFAKYGTFEYRVITVRNGEISDSLDIFDSLILHYSVIAYPYRYFKPLSAISALKILDFKGAKVAFTQDEQRAGLERLQFLNSIGIHHLFTVADSSLYELLYSSNIRNFSLSTVLTGYVSDEHLALAKNRVPLNQRKLDLAYRGRALPEWMGETGTLKGRIPNIVKSNPKMTKYNFSVSGLESERLYGESWYAFLQTARVSIGTPSGSDYLDLEGMYLENWVPHPGNTLIECQPPIRACYQVISPRYFDYVSAGNLIALTPGSYSRIPIVGTYMNLRNDLDNLPQILEFSKSAKAQKIVDLNQEAILQNQNYHFRELVRIVENKLSSIKTIKKGGYLSHLEVDNGKHSVLPDNESKIAGFARRVIPSRFAKLIGKQKSRLYFYIGILSTRNVDICISKLQKIGNYSVFDRLNLSLMKESLILQRLTGSKERTLQIDSINSKTVNLKLKVENGCKLHYDSILDQRIWKIDVSSFGCLPTAINLKTLPKKFKYNLKTLVEYINLES